MNIQNELATHIAFIAKSEKNKTVTVYIDCLIDALLDLVNEYVDNETIKQLLIDIYGLVVFDDHYDTATVIAA